MSDAAYAAFRRWARGEGDFVMDAKTGQIGDPNEASVYLKSCDVCGAPGPREFHRDGCAVAGGRAALHEAGDGLGDVACRNYPLGYPGCHPADPVACPECMDGRAHVAIFGDRARDPNRVLFLEVRALVPGACFVVHRGREPAYAMKVLEDVRRLIACANHDGHRITPAEALDRVGLPRRRSLWRWLWAWKRGERA